MKEKLYGILEEEKLALKELLDKLEEQHGYIAKNNVVAMEQAVKDIERVNIRVAKGEMERRNLLGKCNMREVIDEFKDEKLSDLYRDIKKLIEELQLQKDTNQLLIRQGLSLTNSLLGVFKPQGQTPNTYNSYGKVKR